MTLNSTTMISNAHGKPTPRRPLWQPQKSFYYPGGAHMLIVNIPENLSDKIKESAKQACQSPEAYVVEMIEEMIAHKSADDETAYLWKSEKNRQRLDEAVKGIASGEYASYGLLDGNN